MARAISYFIFSSNGSYLRWDDDTTIDFRIRQYEMSITGGGGVDRLYVGTGTKVDAGALFASANTDELYFSGNFNDYDQTISAGGVYTFTGKVSGSHAGEVVSFSMNSNGDKLVFANGHITVKSSDYLSVSGSYSSILAGSLTLATQPDPASGAEPGNKPAKVFVFDGGGINIPQLPIVKEAIAVSGGGGVDKFYVRKGTNADAIGLFASAGQDVLYLTGRFGDYTQTKSAGGVYTFTRNFTDAADASLTEVVSFSMNSSGDQLVFADGGVTLRLADYLSGGSYADITAGQLNPLIITPGLLAPTPNLILASDTGSSASDRLTNNATINVTGLVTGGTWQYQVDGTAGSWTTGTASSLIASSGAHTYFVRQFDMAGLSSGVSTAVTYTLDTSAPSALGSVATSANVAENSRGEVTLTANANDVPASTSVTWSLGTGLDSALFDITSAGVLSFKIAPNYEMPRGSAFNADSNNDAYTVNVIATDAAGNASAPSAIVVNVTDVNEAPFAVMIPARAATQNVAFSYDVSGSFSDRDTQASDATWRTLTYTATGLPSGLTIADSTGVISGMASATTANPATVTVTATDGLGLNVTQTFTLSVVDAPVISSFTVSDTTTANGAQLGRSGEALVFVVTMSEAVTVTPATGAGAVAPQITFSVNGQAVTATYASGSGTSVLTFSGGTVPASGDGTAISVTSIALNSGTVTSNSSGRGWVSTTVGQSYNGYTVDNTVLIPSLTLASDTGSSASDTLTNNVTIKVGGLESGATWQYQEDNSAWAAGTGSSFTASTGAHSYLVRQTDAAGNTSVDSTAVTYTFDTTAPATPNLTLASDTGTSASDGLTNNLTINVGGLETGTMWQYQVDGSGSWMMGTASSFTASSGAHSYSVIQTDAAGNTSDASTAVSYTVDTTAPATPSLTLASDTGSSASDRLTSNATINVSGLETGATWQYQEDSSGSWMTGTASSFTASEGTHSYLVRQTDAAGNTSVDSTAVTYTFDTTALAPSLTLASDTGSSASDKLTNNLTINVGGLENGATWQYQDNGGTWITGTASSFIASSGEHTYLVRQTDAAGNPSEASTAVTYTFDTSAPTTPSLTLASDTGSSASDGLTSNATINVSALETGTTWQYQVDNGSWATGTASSFTASSGEHTYLVRQIDAAGNPSVASTAVTYTLDNTAPTVNTTSFNVAENSTTVGSLAASETVTWALGSGDDTGLFTLTNGVLSFTNAPDFERPRGSDFNAANNNDAYTINVTVTDLVGHVGTQVLVVNVTDVNEAPTVVAQTPTSSVSVNQAVNLNVASAFSDPDNETNSATALAGKWGTLTYTTTGLPAGLSINASTGVIGGTATATTASAASVTVTATDGGGRSVTETFSLNVVAAPVVQSFTVSDTTLTNGAQLGKSGEALVFVVTMSEAVTVTPATGAGAVAPQITFNVNGQAVTANYASGSGTSVLTFTGGTVPATGNGTAISITSIALNGGTVMGNSSAQGLIIASVGQAYAGYTVDNTVLTPTLKLASDTGVSASDGITSNSNATVNVLGLESGAMWEYRVDGSGSWMTGTASSFTATSGAHSYSVHQTDIAGNPSGEGTANYTVIPPPSLNINDAVNNRNLQNASALLVANLDRTPLDYGRGYYFDSDLTFEMWANFTSTTEVLLVSNHIVGAGFIDNTAWSINAAGKLVFNTSVVNVVNSGGLRTVTDVFHAATSTSNVRFNEWAHYAVTATTSGQVNFYINGQAAGTTNLGANIVGRRLRAIDSEYFNSRFALNSYQTNVGISDTPAQITDVRISNTTARTATEILDDYNLSSTGNGLNRSFPEDANLTYSLTGYALRATGARLNMSVADSVVSVVVSVSGRPVLAKESLRVNGVLIAHLDGSDAQLSGNFTLGTDSWHWAYSNASFTFNLNGASANASATQVKSLLDALGYNTPQPTERIFTITVQDVAGNNSVATSYIDLVIVAPTLSLANDSGVGGDKLTNNAIINVNGVENEATWEYKVDNSGSWVTGTGTSFTATSGTHSYFVRQTDVAYNKSVESSATYTLDTSPPTALAIVGTSNNIDENTLGAVTLTANANDVPASTNVTWSLGTGLDSTLFNITSAGVLSFINAPNYEMPRGSAFSAASNNNAYTVNVIATDTAGNPSAPSAIVVNVIDVNEAPQSANPVMSPQFAQRNIPFELTGDNFSDPDTQASNAAWRTLSYTASGLPTGLSINASTGTISGTAATAQTASPVTITATDGAGLSATQTFTLTVQDGVFLQRLNVVDNAQAGMPANMLTFTLTMSEAVTVTGTPTLTFSVNSVDVTASYSQGSGSDTLKFTASLPSTGNGNHINIKSVGNSTITGTVSALPWSITTPGAIYYDYTVDNVALPPSLSLVSDSGREGFDGVTNFASVRVSGLETGASWQYQMDGGTWIQGTGSSFTANSGSHVYAVRQIDVLGNTSVASDLVSYTLDTSIPSMPTLSLASDSGTSTSDGLTTNPIINILALQNDATWSYQMDGGLWLNGGGSSLIANPGRHSYSVRQVSLAGNTSVASVPVVYALATATPSIAQLTFDTPENSAFSTNLMVTKDAVVTTVNLTLGTGADSDRFDLRFANNNWILSWKGSPPNYEMPRGLMYSASNSSSYIVNVNITDNAGNNITQQVRVNVTDVNETPLATGVVPDQTAAQNVAYSFDVRNYFSDPDTGNNNPSAVTGRWGTLTYSATGLSAIAGLNLSSAGVISGTVASTLAASVITVTASDGGSLSATQTFNLQVVNAPVLSAFTVTDAGNDNGTTLGKSGEALSFVVTMSEAVTVDNHSMPAHTPSIIFSVNGQAVTATYASGSGTSMLTFTGGTVPVGNGNNISVTGITLNGGSVTGNVSNAAWAVAAVGQNYRGYTVDNIALAPSLKLASDTGLSASDGITMNATVNVLGLESAATWSYQVDGSGNWIAGVNSSFVASSGLHSYWVQQIDVAGNTSVTNSAFVYNVDQTAPVALTLALASDTGSSSTDGVTRNPTINVIGLEAGATWTYQVDLMTPGINGTGSSFTAQPGFHLYQATQTDVAGNRSAQLGMWWGAALETPSVATPLQVNSVELRSAGVQRNTLHAGSVVTALVTLSETVAISSAVGTPQLKLKIGNSVVQADWWDVTLWSSQQVSTPPIGSKTNVLLFTYVILPGQEDVNGISMPENALTIPVGMGVESGTVFSTSNPATFLLAQPTALADNAKLVVKTNNNVSLQNIVAGTNGFVIHGLTDGLRHPDAYRPDLAREGSTIAAAGDVNGDGYADFIFAEPQANDSAGASYVVFGGPNRSTALSANALGTAGFAINGANTTSIVNDQNVVTYAYSGFSVANAGDINGDGLSDLIIGAPQNPALGATVEASGKAYLVFGKTNSSTVNLSAVEQGSGGFVLYGALERIGNLGPIHYRSDTIGWSVATAGDVNGDGFADFVVSAPLAYSPPNPQGLVGSGRGVSYVVFGKADWSGVSALNVNDVLAGTGGFVIQQVIDGNNFFSGSSVSSLGDINGDGLADLVIASSQSVSSRLGYIVFGKKDSSAVNLTAGAAGIVSISGVYSDSFSVSAAGDVNGDGFADFIVGAHTAGATNTAGAGLSYVVFGKSNWIDGSEINLNTVAAGTGGFVIRGEINGINGEFGDRSGYSVASAGDFNGDGLADLIISSPSPLYGDTTRLSNRSYVVYGKSDTTAINLSDVALGRGGFSIEGGVQNGLSVSSAGDINGDGFSDLLITAPTLSNALSTTTMTINGQTVTYSSPSTEIFSAGYVIFGGPSYSSGLLVQAAAGVANGGSANEMIVGGKDDEVLTGGGGADRFFGGAGNDVVALTGYDIANLLTRAPIEGVYSTVDGGTGIDTLRLVGGAFLDLTAIANVATGNPNIKSRISSIERIDLANDSASNTLILAVGDVLDMAGMNSFNTGNNGWSNVDAGTALGSSVQKHQLVIDGTLSDVVKIKNFNTEWTRAQTGGSNDTVSYIDHGTTHNYAVYNSVNGNAQLLIDTRITPILG